jgi:hypothetical protein
VALVRETNPISHFSNGEPGNSQQHLCSVHPPMGNVAVWWLTCGSLKSTGEVKGTHVNHSSQVSNGQIFSQLVFDEICNLVQLEGIQWSILQSRLNYRATIVS